MAHYIFKAKRANGEIYSAERDMDDRYQLYKMLRESGEEIVSLEEKKQQKSLNFNISFGLFGNIKVTDKINFARNTGAMLEAGLSLSRVLSVLERQTHSKKFKAVIADTIETVNKGMTFSEALAKHPKVFPQLFISMVHAGEQSGTLAESLKVVALQMDRTHALERRIKGALIYPSIIVGLMVVIAILMFIFVIPVLMVTFTELNVELPFTTRVILYISNTIQEHGLIVLLAVIGIFSGLSWWSRKEAGKRFFHSLILKIPIVGPLVQEVNAARTSRTLSSLISSGVDIIESVKITANVVQNVHFRAVLVKAGEAIRKGELMSKIFTENTHLYPVFLSEMMSVGEETGKIGEMLIGVAHYYEDDVEQKTKDMSTVIEPILMIVIAFGVGFFALAMISPMYSLVDAI